MTCHITYLPWQCLLASPPSPVPPPQPLTPRSPCKNIGLSVTSLVHLLTAVSVVVCESGYRAVSSRNIKGGCQQEH
jgi:hypothetical protein